MFNHPEHVANVLYQNSCGVGHVVQVVLGEIRQAGAGHQVQVFQGSVEPFAQAGVKVEQWGVAVDQEPVGRTPGPQAAQAKCGSKPPPTGDLIVWIYRGMIRGLIGRCLLEIGQSAYS